MKEDQATGAATAETRLAERRRHARTRRFGTQRLEVTRSETVEGGRVMQCTLWDFTEAGLGMDCAAPLEPSEILEIEGDLRAPDYSMHLFASARVVYCRTVSAGRYRAGVAFVDVRYRRLEDEQPS